MASRNDHFDQLTGAFDAPIAPSPAFAARLRAQLLAELADSPRPVASSPNGRKEPIMLANSSPFIQHPMCRLRATQRRAVLVLPRWTPATVLINIAAILLLLLIGTGISLHFLDSNHGSPSPYQLPAVSSSVSVPGSPTPSPVTNSAAAQPGANPGQTNQYDVSIGTPKRLNLLGEAQPDAQLGAGPIVSGGTLYRIDEPTGQAASNASTVSAVSLVDGSARTVFSDPSHNAAAVMTRGDQLLVVANPVIGTTTNAALIAVDPATGHALWLLDLFAGSAAEVKPLLAGNMVFVADQSGKVYGVDLTAHRVIWSAPVSSLGEPPELLAADDSLLYVVNGFDLSAVDQATGAMRWQADLSHDLLGVTSIAVGEGHIIVGGQIAPGRDAESATPASAATPEENLNRSRVVAITTQNHAIEWHWDTPDPLSKLFVVTSGKVIVGHGQGPFGNATALNLATGKVAWQLDGATPVFADRDQVVAVTLQVSVAPGTRPSTPVASGRVPVFQKPPETVTSVTLLGIDSATGTTQWVQGENLGIGEPVVFLPIDQGVVIPLSSGQVVVLRD